MDSSSGKGLPPESDHRSATSARPETAPNGETPFSEVPVYGNTFRDFSKDSRGEHERLQTEVGHLSDQNRRFFIGSLAREEAEAKIRQCGKMCFLLYSEIDATMPPQLTLIYLSRKSVIHRFPVCTSKSLKRNPEGGALLAIEQFFIFADAFFQSLNDLVDFYSEFIAAGRIDCEREDCDPFEYAFPDFQKVEMHKLKSGRCCEGQHGRRDVR
ncbi:hypothetical protein QR680_018590 [Steinernema hermaphroditum]|uniref:SH2 domain-containing protein n=1 Tax=Steinernema hermaphroditum TaxID=289476 RepID=A0AA39HKR9_9BILA|nr:hypothetical protein QR680_018590 [Steinernema hermaphroditum]